jgi:protein phosphatase 1G
MGAALDKPITDKTTERGEGQLGDGSTYKFGASGMQGWRREMEDRHTCCTEIEGLPGHAFFAVYDGHGGDEAADLSEQRLLPTILGQEAAAAYREGGCVDPGLLEVAMVAAFKQCDAEIRPLISRSGTTAVTCFVTPTHFICANAGDSRGVYCKARSDGAAQPESLQGLSGADLKRRLHALGVDFSGCVEKGELQSLLERSELGSGARTVVALSEDHKPENEIERTRVLKAGGTVTQGAHAARRSSRASQGAASNQACARVCVVPLSVRCFFTGGFGGPMRIDGSLAVARALGDFSYKDAALPPEEQKVSPVPDVTIFPREPASDQLMLLACDGIFDVVSNGEVCEVISMLLEEGERDMGKVVEELLMICLEKDSRCVLRCAVCCAALLPRYPMLRCPVAVLSCAALSCCRAAAACLHARMGVVYGLLLTRACMRLLHA